MPYFERKQPCKLSDVQLTRKGELSNKKKKDIVPGFKQELMAPIQ